MQILRIFNRYPNSNHAVIHLHDDFTHSRGFPLLWIFSPLTPNPFSVLHLYGFSMAHGTVLCASNKIGTIVIITADISIEHFRVTASRSRVFNQIQLNSENPYITAQCCIWCDAICSGSRMNSNKKKMLLPKSFAPINSQCIDFGCCVHTTNKSAFRIYANKTLYMCILSISVLNTLQKSTHKMSFFSICDYQWLSGFL